MEVGKAIDSVIIFGGIGAMAYLLFKKNTIVNSTVTTKTLINGIEQDQYNKEKAKLCMQSINKGAYSGSDFLRNCLSIQEKTELTENLIDQNALVINNKDYNTWDAATRKYYTPTGDIKANTCLELDILIKKLGDNLVHYYGFVASGLSNYNEIIRVTEKVKSDAIDKFNKFSCRDKIEAVRTRTLVDLQQKSSIKAEESILNKGFSEQKTYIILGALVVLTGFYLVVKK